MPVTKIAQTYWVVQLANGNYVKSWQYSQDLFETIPTANILVAEDFSDNFEGFRKFFRHRGASLLEVQATIKIKEIHTP